jgi:hypothetical protein
MEKKVVYFAKPGRQNTAAVVRAVRERVEELGIRHVVVATASGDTPVAMAAGLKGSGATVVAVTYHAGAHGGDGIGLTQKNRRKLQGGRHRIVTCSHALSGVERSITQKLGGTSRVEIIAHTLRRFGCEGIKVAVEIAVMAADAGAVPTDREIVAVGGSGKGADAAVVLKAAHMNNFFDLEVREIVAKARQRSA